MKRDEKIEQTIKEKKVFLVIDKPKFQYWGIKGVSNKPYNVNYYKKVDKYSCDCGNILKTECYHIECVRRMQANNDDGIEYYEDDPK